MNEASVNATMQGGTAGLVGVGVAHIENLYVSAPTSAPAATQSAGPIPHCPYPGLAYFGPEDASRFFGREQAKQALVAAVTKRSFTALVGASGCGKSSVVLAGLAPRLETQGGWRSTYFRIGTEPDKNPFAALARALSPLLGNDDVVDRMTRAQKLANSLASGDISLVNVVAQCRATNAGKRILLIADQFEEAFTLVSDDTLRERFINALIEAFPDPAQGAAPDMCLVLTLRADFYNAALRYRPIADRLQDHVENLGPLTREELREAIAKPAEAVDVGFEPGLVDTILDDVEKRPGNLPLLQFALREMWGRLGKPLMTRADYDAIGGVEGALAKRAQAIFNNATEDGKDEQQVGLFRRLFTRLVTLGEGAEDARRIVGRDELGPEAWALAQKLADEDNRLVVTTMFTPGRETAEVVHEALIRNWPELVKWVGRDRAFISWRNQLMSRLEEWRANPADAGTLLRGGPLAVAEEWAARRGSELNDEEMSFVTASIALRNTEEHRAKQELKEKLAQIAELKRQRANFLAALGGIELARGSLHAALRFATRGVHDDLALGSEPIAATASMATLAVALWQSHWRLGFRASDEGLASVAYSPDGTHIVTASRDKTVRIWDSATAEEVAVLRGHTNVVYSAAYSPDGTRIVTASGDQTARVWDAATAMEIIVLRGHYRRVLSAAFSPDGAHIVTASRDGTARVWDAATAKEIAVLHGHDQGMNSAAYSPNGMRIVTASDDWTARVWEAATAIEIAVLRGHEDIVHFAAFGPDGTRILTSSNDKTARMWDTATAKEIAVLRGHDGIISSEVFSPDGTRIVTASYDNTARVWNAATGTNINLLLGHEDRVTSAAFAPSGTRIVTASRDKTVRIWDAASANEISVLQGHENGVSSAAFSSDGMHIVTASWDKTARIWHPTLGKEIAILRGHERGVVSAAFSPDGLRVVTTSGDTTVRIWDPTTAKEIAILRGHEREVVSTAFSPDGSRIVTASRDMTARIWDPTMAKAIAVLRGHEREVVSAAFSPDGSRIVTASGDKTLRIWDPASAKEIAVLRGDGSYVLSATFSPDGMSIVTASDDGTARVWDAATGKENAVLRGHEDLVSSAAFSPNGTRIVTASDDRTARVWDAATGKEIAVLRGHENIVSSAAFSPDGTRVVTASNDNTTRVWDVQFATMKPREILVEICKRRVVGFSTMTRDEMRLAGYPDSEPLIDVCAGVAEARQ